MHYSFNNLTAYGNHYIPYDYKMAIAEDLAELAAENGVSLEKAIKDFRDVLTGANDESYFCSDFEAQLALVGNVPLIYEAEQAGYLDNIDLSDPETIDIWLRAYLLDYHRDEILRLASRE